MHGYALLEISSNPVESLGETICSASDVLGKINGFIQGKLDDALNVSSLNLRMQSQQMILQDQAVLLAR